MKRFNYYIFTSLLYMATLLSCQKEKSYEYQVGDPTLAIKSDVSKALFGDSLSFEVEVNDSQIDLSTLKAQLYFTDDLVSEMVIRTKQPGTYRGKIYVPSYKNIPNGTATLKFIVENISQKKVEKIVDLPITSPDFPYIELITASKTYKLLKQADNTYALTENLPFSVKGYLQTPKVGSHGNVMQFGWLNNEIALGNTNEIPFSNSTSGTYTIQFNTLTYEASPFIIAYALNGQVFTRIDDNRYKVELMINKGEPITIDGIEDLSEWWIDTDYFSQDTDGNLTSNVINGKYRITADFAKKYFIIEAMSGNDLASLQADGTGAIWIIGEGIGKPAVATNQVGWNPDNALCLAPIGNKKYQITVTGDQTVWMDYINFKFFHQKNWGGEFGGSSISTTSDLIFIGNGSNGRDSGNLGLLTGKTIAKDKSYILTVDVSAGNNNATLEVKEK